MTARALAGPGWPLTLWGYLLREFGRALLLALGGFLLVYLCVDFLERAPRFVQAGATAMQIVRYFLLKIPLIVTQMIPVAVLAGTLLSFGALSRHAEIMAMRSSGLSLTGISAPILATALTLSVGTFAWNEWVVPQAAERAHHLEQVEITKKKFAGHFRRSAIWYRSGSGFVNIDWFDESTATLHGVRVLELTDSYRLRRLLTAPRLRWSGEAWGGEGAFEVDFTKAGSDRVKPLSTVSLAETPEDFAAVARKPEDLTSRELARQIADLDSKGLDTTEMSVDLWLKSAVPFVSVIMALIGVPLASRSRRNTSAAANMAAAIAVGFGYWIVLALSISLGRTGVIPPWAAAWGANALFLGVGLVLYLSSE